jgi:hypothetical protein
MVVVMEVMPAPPQWGVKLEVLVVLAAILVLVVLVVMVTRMDLMAQEAAVVVVVALLMMIASPPVLVVVSVLTEKVATALAGCAGTVIYLMMVKEVMEARVAVMRVRDRIAQVTNPIQDCMAGVVVEVFRVI